jgi:hypothetical protein
MRPRPIAAGPQGEPFGLPGLCRLLACCLLLCLSAACTVPKELPDLEPRAPQLSDEQQAGRIWRAFSHRFAGLEGMGGPFRITTGLRYSDPQTRNTRAEALLWGNGGPGNPWPLRLDIRAGIGTVAAKAREDQNSLIAYVPDDNTAYVQTGEQRSLAAFGTPIPLDLADLGLILTGRSGTLFLPAGANAATPPPWSAASEDSADFRLDSARLPGIVILGASGLPLAWRESREGGWSMAFTYSADEPDRLEKLRIAHPQGYSALIVVKDVARPAAPFSSAQLALPLPPGVAKKLMHQ